MAQRSLYDLINGEFASGNPNLAQGAANPDAVIARQRFVYNGVGRHYDVDHPWVLGGTGTGTLDFNGFKLYSSSGNKHMDFGNKRPFSKTGCVMIFSTSQVGEGGSYYGGLYRTTNTYNRDTIHTFVHASGHNITTGNSSSSGSTDTSDNQASSKYWRQFTTFKCHQLDGSSQLYVNGRLDVTRTSTQPQLDMQPFFYKASSAGSLCVRYVEAYNI